MEPGRSYAIPPDLLALLPPAPAFDHTLRLADAGPPEAEIAADMRIAERFLLALLALGQDGQLEAIPTGGLNKASLVRMAQWRDPADKFKGASREDHWPFVSFLRRIAEGAGLLHAGADSQLRTTRAALDWLQQPPDERARRLLEGWVDSSWDELVHFLGMKVQKRYSRDLPRTKRTILQLLGQVPPGQWVALDEFVAEVRRVAPDFARPDGRYDTVGSDQLYAPAAQRLRALGRCRGPAAAHDRRQHTALAGPGRPGHAGRQPGQLPAEPAWRGAARRGRQGQPRCRSSRWWSSRTSRSSRQPSPRPTRASSWAAWPCAPLAKTIPRSIS